MSRATERETKTVSGETESRTPSAVEQSLEEFIARANTVTPPPAAPRTTVLEDSSPSGKRRRREADLAANDKTEIVERPLPYTPPGQRRLVWGIVALAFAAGAGMVFFALRLAAPRPAETVSAPIPILPPPVVVIPQPTVERLPEPAPPPAKAVEAAPPAAAPAPAKKPRPSKKTEARAPKPANGLVDPFAE